MDPFSYDVVLVLERNEGGAGSVLSSTLIVLSESSEPSQNISTVLVVAALVFTSIAIFTIQSRR